MDRPTDVLSFSQVEGEEPVVVPELLGDVVISWETASRQARRLDRPVSSEMKRLLIHGVLHLLGYDHEGDADAAEAMREMEEKYMETVNSER
jgi:probable rRNA maturation factor